MNLSTTFFFHLQELVAAGPNQKNWKGITIAIAVIILILGSVGISVLILTPPEEEPRVKGQRFSIQQVLDPTFNPPPFNGTWISGTRFISHIYSKNALEN